jgi:GNAT superfamily N-acetyltransferase
MAAAATIHHYDSLKRDAELAAQLDAIFFEASNTKTFASDEARSAFRERWLGRYLRDDPEFAYVALAPAGNVIGYLVGAVDDPAIAPRFADIGHFKTFQHLTSQFPAHLHINLAPEARSQGIGSRLVEGFVADIKKTGVPGVHVVTSRDARNVRFYARNHFTEAGSAGEGLREVVFLARTL